MADQIKRITIGFQAAPPLALRLSEGQLQRLHDMLGKDEWLEVEAEDAHVTLDLDEVLYVRVEKDAERVGFGLAG